MIVADIQSLVLISLVSYYHTYGFLIKTLDDFFSSAARVVDIEIAIPSMVPFFPVIRGSHAPFSNHVPLLQLLAFS
jgi:hypothetical protein